MAHKPEARVALRAAYLGGLGMELAAQKAGIPLPTARRWKTEAHKAGDDWDTQLGAALLTAGGGMDQALSRVVSAVIVEAETTVALLKDSTDLGPLERTQAISSLTDSLVKASAVAARLMPAVDKLAIETAAVKRFADLFVKHHVADAGKMIAVLELFARHG